MTVAQKQEVKFWSNLGLSTATLIFLITLSYNVGKIKEEFRQDINHNKESIIEHSTDFNVHMPFEKKIEVFVPRVELDSRLKSIEDNQHDMKVTQEKMYQLLLKK